MVKEALWMQAESLPPLLQGFSFLILIFFQLAGGVTEGCCQLVPCGMLHLNVNDPTPSLLQTSGSSADILLQTSDEELVVSYCGLQQTCEILSRAFKGIRECWENEAKGNNWGSQPVKLMQGRVAYTSAGSSCRPIPWRFLLQKLSMSGQKRPTRLRQVC